MNENIDEFISDWCNDNIDLELAQQVDEYEKKSRFASVNDKDVDKILKDSHSVNKETYKVGYKPL